MGPSLVVAVLGSVAVFAHAQRPTDIVKWNAAVLKASPTGVTVGLSANVQKGWHMYAVSQPTGGPTPLVVSTPAESGYSLASPVAEAKPIHHFDPAFKMDTLYYLDAVKLTVALRKTGIPAGKDIPVNVRFQACNDSLCLPPYTAHLTATPGGK